MDRRRRHVGLVPHAVNVRGVEVERATRLVVLRPLANPAILVAVEVILAEHAAADVDAPRRAIVIVIAGVLAVHPADQPDVDVRVAIELLVLPLLRIVTLELLPEALVLPDLARERVELRSTEVNTGSETIGKECR